MGNFILLFIISSIFLQFCFHQTAAMPQWDPMYAEAQRSADARKSEMECFRMEGESCQDEVLGLAGQCPCDLGLRCVYNVCIAIHTNNDPSNMNNDYPSASENNQEQSHLYYDE